MKENLLTSFKETIVGDEYLTTPHDYHRDNSGNYGNTRNQFLSAKLLLELQKTLPSYANTLVQVFTIPVKIKENEGKKVIDIDPEYVLQIRDSLSEKTKEQLSEALEPIPTSINSLKSDIYELIEELDDMFEEADEEKREKLTLKRNMLYNAIDKILEQDISPQYNAYKLQFEMDLTDGDTMDEDPLEEQVEKIKTLLMKFMQSFSKQEIINFHIEDGSGILFHILDTAEQYLSEKYNSNAQEKNVDEERIRDAIQNCILNLNNIFVPKSWTKKEKEDSIENLDERIITLSENIFWYLGWLRQEPIGNELYIIKEKIDSFFTTFCKEEYGDKNALEKWLLLGEDFSFIHRLIDDLLILKEYPYDTINPDSGLWMCLSLLNSYDTGKKKKMWILVNKLEENCTLQDINKQLYHKDIIILQELAAEEECYRFATVLRDMKPKI